MREVLCPRACGRQEVSKIVALIMTQTVLSLSIKYPLFVREISHARLKSFQSAAGPNYLFSGKGHFRLVRSDIRLVFKFSGCVIYNTAVRRASLRLSDLAASGYRDTGFVDTEEDPI